MMKSYFGAMALNISRIKRVSWRSTGIVMGRANSTRITAGKGDVISTRARHEIRGAPDLRRQIRLRRGNRFCAHLVFHLAARALHGGQLGA